MSRECASGRVVELIDRVGIPAERAVADLRLHPVALAVDAEAPVPRDDCHFIGDVSVERCVDLHGAARAQLGAFDLKYLLSVRPQVVLRLDGTTFRGHVPFLSSFNPVGTEMGWTELSTAFAGRRNMLPV